jgi:hypothetical protein
LKHAGELKIFDEQMQAELFRRQNLIIDNPLLTDEVIVTRISALNKKYYLWKNMLEKADMCSSARLVRNLKLTETTTAKSCDKVTFEIPYQNLTSDEVRILSDKARSLGGDTFDWIVLCKEIEESRNDNRHMANRVGDIEFRPTISMMNWTKHVPAEKNWFKDLKARFSMGTTQLTKFEKQITSPVPIYLELFLNALTSSRIDPLSSMEDKVRNIQRYVSRFTQANINRYDPVNLDSCVLANTELAILLYVQSVSETRVGREIATFRNF